MEPAIAQAIFESITLLGNACTVLEEKCISGISANEETCSNFVMNSIGIVTYLNDIIGHHEGDLIGKECAATGKSVKEVVLERKLLSEDVLDRIFSVENLMDPMDVTVLLKEGLAK